MFELTDEQELEIRMLSDDYTTVALLEDHLTKKYMCEVILDNYQPNPPFNYHYMSSVLGTKDKIYAIVECGFFWLFSSYKDELEPIGFYIRTLGGNIRRQYLHTSNIPLIDKIRYDYGSGTCRFYQGDSRILISGDET